MPNLTDISGIPELWRRTQGDTRIKIAILDGPSDLERACFVGAKFTQYQPYWTKDIEINDEYFYYLKLATEFNQQQKAKKEESDYDKDEAKKEEEEFFKQFPKPILDRILLSSHATHISSTILGQHGTRAPGIAPNCTAINIPIAYDNDNFISPVNLTHAINTALKWGANIIHIAACHPTQTGVTPDLFARAVKQCQDNNILIVAPGGNDKGECWCIPAIIGGVLTVGAMRDDGQPFKFSNYGGDYQTQGVMANGENILGAQPGTDEPIREKGTSCAAPIVTGISALLMSVQLQRGEQPNAEAVRTCILNSAIPCDPEEVEEVERCLRGKLNIPGAYQLLTGEALITRPEIHFQQHTVTPKSNNHPEMNFISVSESRLLTTENLNYSPFQQTLATREGIDSQANVAVTTQLSGAAVATFIPSQPNDGITPSQKSNLVYALGTLGYDFGCEARRDSFKQLMPGVEIDGTIVPANPYDACQMASYLEQNPSESKSLIWTLNQELTPIYAIDPKGAFAADVYETLQAVLAGQVQPQESEDYIERVSVPGRLSDRTVELFSGQVVPVITLPNIRGMYGWKINSLVSAALESVAPQQTDADDVGVRRSLNSFLQRVYFDLHNLGQISKDRALNFAATNAFQAADCFSEAVSTGMELDSIEVEKSPLCRLDSDCWDVKLKFFDPENGRRAKRVYRFTIDVSYIIPVTLGKVRSWSVPK
ncbi:MAG: PatA/PatG family cyanobactin maturation protease [Scytonema sp. PMC 1069.18]|nr:PatA/PatG family cyanobactin maturation protease [Scytonema sp. PMC 1069.18]MEC4880369.1 PatA/PatG family cyanobactin maturation protease [Scytonema sp. PMC 1070.18]